MKPRERIKGKRKSALKRKAKGFSLVELVIAILVLTVMMLGTLSVFTYVVQYNRGNNLRSQALSILQQKAEIYRSSKFTPAVTDSLLLGGVKSTESAVSADNTNFIINTTVDNDPATTGVQISETMPSGAPVTLKEIKIIVTPQAAQAAWQKAIVAEVVIQRVQGN